MNVATESEDWLPIIEYPPLDSVINHFYPLAAVNTCR